MKLKSIIVCLCIIASLPAFAQIKLPRLVRDSMVLQRDMKINIWGWASKSERIRVNFNGKTYRSSAGNDGKWMLQLPPMKAGGPYNMEISGKNKIILHDILIGDVWLCSGQSNMVHQMKLHSVRYPDEIAGAHYPEIRQFWIPTLTGLQGPQENLPSGYWIAADPDKVLEFSAVAYFFAKDLYQKYHVPIGIINASVGGTPIEAWTSEEGLTNFPSILKTIERNKDTAYTNGFSRRSAAGMSAMPKPVDKGLAGTAPWYSPAYIPRGWRPIGIPGYWEDQGLKNLDGIVWYRREIDVPGSMTGKAAKVFLGRIVNADALYINGKEVGNTTYQYPQRRYVVPADLLKPGKNLFVVRVTNSIGKGGFVPDKPYCLIAGDDTVDLKGYWEYKVGAVFVPVQRAGGDVGFSAQNAPTALYNAMIAPLIPYTIKGFIWYQGESNTGRAAEYAKLQPAMIADWRRQWKEGDIPFLYVQLPGFGDYNYLPAESGWAELREAQLKSLSVPNTAMAVAIDLGEWNDLHPDRKRPVGDRLALAAEKIAYGDSVVYSGPVYRSSTVSGSKIIISFANPGSGLISRDGEEPQEFAIAGADKKFVWAHAEIEGDKVVVWSDEIKDPKYVRYAWADDPVNPNLYNKEGLPSSPFETEPIAFTAQQDHDDMMRQLGITELRPGPSGDANAPNHANYDEAMANPCPRLPDILTLKDGKKVTTPDMWWGQRRPEIVADLEREVYGRIPAHVPQVTWAVQGTGRDSVGGMPVITRELTGHVDNTDYHLIDVNIKMTLVLPANAKAPVPVLMMFGRRRDSLTTGQLIADGWGYALIDPGSIQADNGAGLTQGIIGLVNKGQPRKPEDWGALRAWAWGAARALDYLETVPAVDAKKVGIEGVSRYGKAALVTLAFEPRFAVGLIGSSGKGGATLLRRNYGEAVESLTGGEYYWMAGNFIKYGASAANFGSKTSCDLDVDSHELIALCAPRLTFISYGIPEKGDAHWLDHEGSFMATIAAGAVFKLLGAKDLGVSNDYMKEPMPPVNTGLLDGELAWRQHDGGHTDAPNFKYFVPWASGFFHYTPKVSGNGNAAPLHAQSDHQLWLNDGKANPVTVICFGHSSTLTIAREELTNGWKGKPGATVHLIIKKDKALRHDGFRLGENTIGATTDIGILYGVYDLLRRQRTGETIVGEVSNPSYEIRLLDHWDNLNGTVERGYAGHSIFWRKDDPFMVTDADTALWREYARANASIGINGSVVDNVNSSPLILTANYLARVKAIADVLRPYGVKTYLAVNFASPIGTGGLKTADPLDPSVIAWWKGKIKEIYGIIPDFGGFLVKASSEGQPGPQQYGRSHADGANMLADALLPYGGIVMWRAFVYAANDNDRAKQAYSEFMPLDGKFRDNVIIQVKNGPVDFQPREPFSPLFGAMKKTAVMPEFQITQEYLGHSVYLVFLSTMWEECLKSDTYQQGVGSTVARCTDGAVYPQKYTAIAGVSNVGLDANWCGYLFSQANWYAFGRLAWCDTMNSAQIADEWLKLTFSNDSSLNPSFLLPVRQMMLDSREVAVDFMMPLGLHHIMSANGHYGPGPWWAPKNVRADWTPPYYHQAAANGIGFDRTTKGSDAVSQYHEPLASEFNDVADCPEKYLLWFHHLPWNYQMKNGQTLWDAICYHYDKGVRQVREFQRVWDKAQPFVDSVRFTEVEVKLRAQCANAILWKDACLLYFQQFSRMPIPYDIEPPVHDLDDIMANEFK